MDFENLLIELNRRMLQDIKLLTRSAENIRLLIGTNAVDHCGFDLLKQEQIIPLPWYKLLSQTDLGGICVDFSSIKFLETMENILFNSDQKYAFQKWIMEKISQAEKQDTMLSTMDHVADDKSHPDYNGHRLWAEYILKEIIK